MAISQETMLYGIALPVGLGHLREVIEASRSMLDLEDDWDEAGSPGYDEATWRRAVEFLVRNATLRWDECRLRTDAPRIGKGPDGSIDLDWRLPNRELLVNIPTDPEAPATYYGDDGSGNFSTKGSLDIARRNHWLLMWLTA
jgi:hypothetical protein